MPLNAGGAGGSATNPILAGLTVAAIGYADSMNLTQGVKSGIDPATGYPITNEVTAGLSPQASQVTPAGLTGSFVFATGDLTIGSTTGLAVGMYMRLNAGAEYALARVLEVVSGTVVRFEKKPFVADRSNVAYQVAWLYTGVAGQGVFVSDVNGVLRYFKFQGSTAAGNVGQLNPIAFYVRNAPNDLMVFNGGAPTNWRTNDPTPEFDILPSWGSKGGIASLQILDSVGMTWWDDTTREIEMYEFNFQAGQALKLTAGDGPKSCRIIARGKLGSANTRELGTVSGTLDTMAPAVGGEVALL